MLCNESAHKIKKFVEKKIEWKKKKKLLQGKKIAAVGTQLLFVEKHLKQQTCFTKKNKDMVKLSFDSHKKNINQKHHLWITIGLNKELWMGESEN